MCAFKGPLFKALAMVYGFRGSFEGPFEGSSYGPSKVPVRVL